LRRIIIVIIIIIIIIIIIHEAGITSNEQWFCWFSNRFLTLVLSWSWWWRIMFH
jgi:hypothetical protein